MKKRMYLTEKELAIGMWLYVKMCIVRYENEYGIFYIGSLKDEYLSAHGFHKLWIFNCILCDKYRACKLCPLHDCISGKKSLYLKVCGNIYLKNKLIKRKYCRNTRLKACNKIIEAIEKDVPDDYNVYHKEE